MVWAIFFTDLWGPGKGKDDGVGSIQGFRQKGLRQADVRIGCVDTGCRSFLGGFVLLGGSLGIPPKGCGFRDPHLWLMKVTSFDCLNPKPSTPEIMSRPPSSRGP